MHGRPGPASGTSRLHKTWGRQGQYYLRTTQVGACRYRQKIHTAGRVPSIIPGRYCSDWPGSNGRNESSDQWRASPRSAPLATLPASKWPRRRGQLQENPAPTLAERGHTLARGELHARLAPRWALSAAAPTHQRVGSLLWGRPGLRRVCAALWAVCGHFRGGSSGFARSTQRAFAIEPRAAAALAFGSVVELTVVESPTGHAPTVARAPCQYKDKSPSAGRGLSLPAPPERRNIRKSERVSRTFAGTRRGRA
jgi:hypothetical protein